MKKRWGEALAPIGAPHPANFDDVRARF